jgi:tetratricopeptide (TPR) repeat protein
MLNILNKYSLDVENAQYNFELAVEYEDIGQTAAATSFYLRAAELSDNKELSYSCLLRMGNCFERQGSREQTVKGLYQQAISILPTRPEAYYLLSIIQRKQSLYHESYTNAQLALSICDFNLERLKYDVGYPGKYGLIYEKAVSSWWWGKNQESRDLFHHLVDNYWEQMDEGHKQSVESNITSIGAGPESQIFHTYTKDDYNKLRFKFKDSEKIERNYSQVYQDMFVLSMTNGKRNGTFLEIGGADPFKGSNSALLEIDYDWTGVSIEYDEKFVDNYRSNRKCKLLHTNALEVDYLKLLEENYNSNVIDYLQLDIEPAKNTFECMLKIPFDKYKFAVITYEHDYYVDVTRSYRQKSRDFLTSKGYKLIANDISGDGKSNFEDWWVHPELVDVDIISKMISITDEIKNAKEYILNSVNENFFIPKIATHKTCWIVDNFYENPDEVRQFALQQEYVEGGFGRGFIGRRTEKQFLFPGLKEKFEEIIGMKITEWESHGMNGRFQNAHAGEPLVWHCDSQKWGGMLYLTPNAPYQCGTTLYAHKQTRARTYYDNGWDAAWKDIPGDPHLDGTSFEPVDVLGNVYNRLVIFDASCIHSASEYFGTVMENSRLWQMFFFDT